MYRRYNCLNPFPSNYYDVRQGPVAVILGILGVIGTAATVYSVGSTAYHSYIYHKHKFIADKCATQHPFQWAEIQTCLENNAVSKNDAETIRNWLEWVDQKLRSAQNTLVTPSPYGKWKVRWGDKDYTLTLNKQPFIGEEIRGTYDWPPTGTLRGHIPEIYNLPIYGSWQDSHPLEIKDASGNVTTKPDSGGYMITFDFGPGGIPRFTGYFTYHSDPNSVRHPWSGTQIQESAQ